MHECCFDTGFPLRRMENRLPSLRSRTCAQGRHALFGCVSALFMCSLGRATAGGCGPDTSRATNTSRSTRLEWVPATKDEWRDLQRRRGCGKARFDRGEDSRARYAACCSRMLPPPEVEVTPVRHLVLKGAGRSIPNSNSLGLRLLPFLERVLVGGVLTFVGDSVTQQA